MKSKRCKPPTTITHDAWPFPSVTYDYARAGVGARQRVIEIDCAEVQEEAARVRAFLTAVRRG